MIATTMTPQALGDDLAAIVGAEHVRLDDNVVWAMPATTEEVAAVLRFADESGVVLSPWGGGTKQDWIAPGKGLLRVSTERMNAVREHAWQDMTCTVEAGCTWLAMEEFLATHGQFVALDPLFAERATVGGIIAANDSGSLRWKYGSLRDLVIGMTLVLADGTIARTGGKVVKNVAGYDLHKLMTGAFGTLGIITEVTFRLHSIPPHTGNFSARAEEANSLGKLLRRVIDSPLNAQRVQLRSSGEGYSLDVQLAALPEVIEEQAGSLGAMAEGLGLTVSASEPEAWGARQACFEEAGSFVVKITMLPAEIAQVATGVRGLGGRFVVQAMGVMIAVVPGEVAGGLSQLRQMIEAARGSLVVLRQPEGATLDRWGKPPDTLPLMRAIKDRFDPHHILNAGRFLGGI
jgi:glycolate oxidase FAD binding subunit